MAGASVLDLIRDRLTVAAVLADSGIDCPATGCRIACPVHRGSGRNFSVSADGAHWRCWSRGCGDGGAHDAIDLYCLLRAGGRWAALACAQRASCLKGMAQVAGVKENAPASPGKRNGASRWARLIPDERERLAIGDILADTTRLDPDDLGASAGYTSPAAQRVLLFLAVANANGQLPRAVTRDWPLYRALTEYACKTT